MKLIVGLGNPGKNYERTRHNIGFMCLDLLAESLGVTIKKIKFESLIAETTYRGEKLILLKPQTYMNLSGNAVRKAVDYYDLELRDILVVYDDIDLDYGSLRLRMKGGAGTHNGMRDIISKLSSEDFPRLRLGIGSPRGDLSSYVLSPFNAFERSELENLLTRGVRACEDVINKGIELAMNRNNG